MKANASAAAAFRTGLLWLHNFHYDEAAADFRRAAQADTTFAPAYWAEALTHSHIVWGEEDLAGARAVLARLGPSADARLALARSSEERAFGEMIEAFYSVGSLPERSAAFAAAGRRWTAASPSLHEAAVFASLAIMFEGFTGAPANADARYNEGAALDERVFAANPRHPGAVHYLIHNYDRPATAARALAAARAYDRLAPDAEHALHMPAHIYHQLGLWADMARANERSIAASRAQGIGEPHSLEWLEYAYLQQGRWREARALIDSARAMVRGKTIDAAENPDMAHIVAAIAFRYASETGRWDAWSTDLSDPMADQQRAANGGPVSPRATSMGANRAYRSAAATLMQVDTASARAVAVRFAGAATGGGRFLANQSAQLRGLLARAAGDRPAAIALWEEGARTAAPPSASPPNTIPVHELLGEDLLAAGRPMEAAQAYELALKRFPNRTAAWLGLARARRAAGDAPGARTAYMAVLTNWKGADRDLPALAEVRRGAAGR